MEDVIKQYQDGKTITVSDDGVSPVEVLKCTLAKVFIAVDGEKYVEVILEATDNDITSEIDALARQIEELQAKLDKMLAQRDTFRAELAKLPKRKPNTFDII